MKTTRPELGFERLLAALGQALLDAPDEELLAVANELGQKPGMKGSVALFGVTSAWQLKDQQPKDRCDRPRRPPAAHARLVALGDGQRGRRHPRTEL